MRLRNRPLLVNGLDDNLYVARQAVERTLRDALEGERNVLIFGERRVGKTTLVRKVVSDLPGDRPAVTVDGSLAGTPAGLLRLIARALGTPPDQVTAADAGSDVLDLLDAIDRLPRRPGTVIVIDGPLDAEIAYTIFGRLRDQLWTLPNTWVVTATPDEIGALRTPPADAFWSLVLELGPMDEREIDELLDRGLDDVERATISDHPERPSRATPGEVVRWAQSVLDNESLGAGPPIVELEHRAAQLGRQASMALAQLDALRRPASAGDPELLARLGWTRPNAARWLARMESAGILRSFTGLAQGQGRPPKLYEPNVSR